MARKKKEPVTETTAEVEPEVETTAEPVVEPVVELTDEEIAIDAALKSDEPLVSLASLAAEETTDDVLKTVIGTYLALMTALGEEAPATNHALANLKSFKPAKKKKAKKEPKFNELKLLKSAITDDEIDFDAIKSMLDNDKVSEGLKLK